ncbi:MAG: hypothetical protein K6E65_08695 [Olsenella sp.]|nr:hypothetical protein [Olsenella sp.]
MVSPQFSAVTYTCLIVLTLALKVGGYLPKDADHVLSRIMVGITLPAAIVENLNGKAVDLSYVHLILLGIGFNLIPLAISKLSDANPQVVAGRMAGASGFNIGNFAIPFVSGFFNPEVLVITSVFDIGNSLMCLGVNGMFIAKEANTSSSTSPIVVCKSVVKSVPVMTYFVMLALCMAGLSMPNQVMAIVDKCDAANPLVAMAVIGTSMSLPVDNSTSGILSAVTILLIRLAAVGIEVGILFLVPISLFERRTLIVLCLSPVAAMSVVFAEQYCLDKGSVASANVLSIPLSLLSMTVALSLM